MIKLDAFFPTRRRKWKATCRPAASTRHAVVVALFALVLHAASATNALAQGPLVSWGSDFYGQVSGTPTGAFLKVAAGSSHDVAIRTDGTLASWGNDEYGVVS